MLIGVFFLAVLLSCEIIFRLAYYFKKGYFGVYSPESWGPDGNKRNAYESHPYISYVKKPNIASSRYPSNEFGYAGCRTIQKVKGKQIRVYVCGGSTVEQNDIDQAHPFDPEVTWPYLLENELSKHTERQVEVINAGCSGYSSAESLIEFILRGIYFEPDFAIFYHGINDAWLAQSVSGFKTDYSHSRCSVNFKPSTPWPDIRWFFLYQFAKLRILSSASQKGLIHFILKQFPLNTDLGQAALGVEAFKSNVRNFCAICIQNNITPILIPWSFHPSLVQAPFGHNPSIATPQAFRALLEGNQRAVRDVAKEFNSCILLDLPEMSPDKFRKEDWLHFSKEGLHEVSIQVSKGLEATFKLL